MTKKRGKAKDGMTELRDGELDEVGGGLLGPATSSGIPKGSKEEQLDIGLLGQDFLRDNNVLDNNDTGNLIKNRPEQDGGHRRPTIARAENCASSPRQIWRL